MGCVLDFDAKNVVLRVTLDGLVTDEGLVECNATVARYYASHPPCRGIVDFSKVTKFEVSSDTIRRLASGSPAIPSENVRVLVTPTDVVYGMARMFQVLGEKTRPELHVVRTLEAAYKLLGVESPEFSPVPAA